MACNRDAGDWSRWKQREQLHDEKKPNLEEVYSAFACSFTDNILGAIRYGYANRINKELGTGGNWM